MTTPPLSVRFALWLDKRATRVVLAAALLLLLGLIGLVIARAEADDLTVNWTQPTTNTNGTAIPASGPGSIASNRVEWGTCSGTAFGTRAGERVVTPAATSTVVTGLAPGTWCARVFATNTYGNESSASAVATRVIPAPTPNPPTAVTVALFAYELRNGKLNRVAGLVERGTRCDGAPLLTVGNREFYAVPRASVWPRPKAGRVIVAQCEAG